MAQEVVDHIVRPMIEVAYAGVKTGVRFTFGTVVGVLGVVFTSTPAGSADEDRIMREINARAKQQLGQGRGAGEEQSQSDIARERERTNGGIGVDFSNNLKQDLGPGEKNTVDIQYAGSRKKDEAAANKAAGYKGTPKGYTWHHVPNYNAKTNTGTMQLVDSNAHRRQHHHGGAGQYEKAHGKKYQ